MQYKDLLDNDSTEKLLKRASEDKELPGKILNSEFVSNKVSSGMEKLSEKADGASSMVKNLMLKGIDGHKSTLDSLTLGYLALELIPVLITMVLCSFFGFSFLISWLLILALVLDLIIYAIVFKFKKSLENSSGAFAVALIASLCEGVILANLGSSIDSTLFSAELAILISSFAIASIFAKILENGYVANSGRRIGLIVLCNMVILFMIFIPTELFPLIPATVITGGYLWFIIGRAKTIVEELKEGDENKLAIYATLLIFKEKIELGYTIIKYLYNLIQKCREKRKENDEHDHGTKKEETKTPVV